MECFLSVLRAKIYGMIRDIGIKSSTTFEISPKSSSLTASALIAQGSSTLSFIKSGVRIRIILRRLKGGHESPSNSLRLCVA